MQYRRKQGGDLSTDDAEVSPQRLYLETGTYSHYENTCAIDGWRREGHVDVQLVTLIKVVALVMIAMSKSRAVVNTRVHWRQQYSERELHITPF